MPGGQINDLPCQRNSFLYHSSQQFGLRHLKGRNYRDTWTPSGALSAEVPGHSILQPSCCVENTLVHWIPLAPLCDPPGIYVEEEGRTPAAFEVRCPDNFLTPIQRFEKYKDDIQSTKTKCVVPSLIRSLETHLLINVLHDFRLFCLEI